MNLLIACLFSLSLVFNSYDAFARTKPKKYQSDDEFREGKSKRLSGILLSSIGGGTGALAFLVGVLWNSCYGASEKDLPTCKRNAKNTMGAGLLVAGASLGFGIPMISVGAGKIGEARSRIDQKYPVKESSEPEGDEAYFNQGGAMVTASHKPLYEDLSLSVRVLNLQF